MSYEYLENLGVSDEEKSKLERLGATTAFALLSMIRAAPEDFHAYLGPDRTREISEALDALINPAQRELLNEPTPEFAIGGAIIDPPPGSTETTDQD